MPGKLLWGYDATNKVWLPVLVDSSGRLKVDMSSINLGDLANVDLTGLADDDFLYYDSGSGLWKPRKLVDADIPSTIARDTEVAAAIVAYAAPLIHAPRHESGGDDALNITYDLMDPLTLPYQIFRRLSRFFHLQFDSYDMITEHIVGTGYTIQTFLSPQVRTGATSGGIAILYQNSRWMYALPPGSYVETLFVNMGGIYSTTRDSTAFLGMALDDTHHITLTDTTKHCGFIFYVSGATATVYASCSNGVAQTKTNLSVDPTGTVIWSIICDKDAGTAKFYRGWELVATHDTNIPDSSLCWKISIVSAANLDQLLSTRNVIFAMR